MKSPSAKSPWIAVIIVFACLFLLIALLSAPPPKELWWIPLLCIAPIVLVFWFYFNTYYELRDDYLYCRSGPLYEKIRYENIKSLRLCENFLSSMAMSSKRIEIRQHGKGYFLGTTYISPIRREEFLSELHKRCSNLD